MCNLACITKNLKILLKVICSFETKINYKNNGDIKKIALIEGQSFWIRYLILIVI